MAFRTAVLILAVVQMVFTGFTALVGAFANGGGVWLRLLVVLVHPLGAAALLLVVLRPGLAIARIRAAMALLSVNVIADLSVALLIAGGAVNGDWPLALVFAVIPAIGIVYARTLISNARATAA